MHIQHGLQDPGFVYNKRSSKINFAAIGNIVPQLHLHVVGRERSDPCWPNPIWGHLTDSPAYADADVTAIRAALAVGYGLVADA